MVDEILLEKMNKVAQEIYNATYDASQIPINQDSVDKLNSLSPDWLKYKLNEKGEPISWVVIVPTTKEIAENFLSENITEREILDLTQPQVSYSALYLCSAITLPEYRNKGLATELLKESIDLIPKTNDCIMFAWPFSAGGEGVIKKLNYEGFDIKIRADGPKL